MFTLLPAGQSWFEWAEGQSAREELRALELRLLGGKELEEEDAQRKAQLEATVKQSLEKRAEASRTALAAASASAREAAPAPAAAAKCVHVATTCDTAASAGEDVPQRVAGRLPGQAAAPVARVARELGPKTAPSDVAAEAPPIPSTPTKLGDILGEEPPEFSTAACSGEGDWMAANLTVLAQLQDGDKLWVDSADRVRAQRGGIVDSGRACHLRAMIRPAHTRARSCHTCRCRRALHTRSAHEQLRRRWSGRAATRTVPHGCLHAHTLFAGTRTDKARAYQAALATGRWAFSDAAPARARQNHRLCRSLPGQGPSSRHIPRPAQGSADLSQCRSTRALSHPRVLYPARLCCLGLRP